MCPVGNSTSVFMQALFFHIGIFSSAKFSATVIILSFEAVVLCGGACIYHKDRCKRLSASGTQVFSYFLRIDLLFVYPRF